MPKRFDQIEMGSTWFRNRATMSLMNEKKPEFLNPKQIARLAILAIILIACWRVWAYAQQSVAPPINSFEACVAAGNPVQESHPERCTANGQSFTKNRD
jgi:hypothetical protein